VHQAGALQEQNRTWDVGAVIPKADASRGRSRHGRSWWPRVISSTPRRCGLAVVLSARVTRRPSPSSPPARGSHGWPLAVAGVRSYERGRRARRGLGDLLGARRRDARDGNVHRRVKSAETALGASRRPHWGLASPVVPCSALAERLRYH